METKTSFYLHNDMLNVLDKLTDEQAGKLFKAIRNYQYGIEDELDLLLEITFMPFKNQFDRDNLKYQSVVERNKENGKKGGRPKKTQDNPKETQKNPKNPSGFLNNPEKPKETLKEKEKEKDNNKGNNTVSETDIDGINFFKSIKDEEEFNDELGWDAYPEVYIPNVFKIVYNKLGCTKSDINDIKNMDGYTNGSNEDKYICVSQYINLNYGDNIIPFDIAQDKLNKIEYNY